MVEQLTLLPGVRIRRQEDCFHLRNVTGQYRLDPDDPETFEKLAQRLEWGETRERLEADLETDLGEVLNWLRSHSFIDTGKATQSRHDRLIAAEAGYRNLEDAKHDIESSTVGFLNLESVGALFDTLSVTGSLDQINEVDFLVAYCESTTELTTVNEQILAEDIPCLFLRKEYGKLLLGPLTVPEVTPCFSCSRHQLNYNPTETVGVEYDLFSPAVVMPLVLRDVYRYLGGFQTPDTIDAVVELSPTDLETEHHHVFKIPHCDGCGTEELVDE